MLTTTLALAALSLAGPPPPPPPPPLVCEMQGKVDWFKGTFEEALARAASSNRLVFLEFWSDSCPRCERLGREALSAPSVVTELKDLICLRVDNESEPGKQLSTRYGVRGLPTLLFLGPDGSPRDGIVGYLPTNLFKRELARIESGEGTIPHRLEQVAANPTDPRLRLDLISRLHVFGATERIEKETAVVIDLIDRGVGFDPASVEDRWQLCVRLRKLGMETRAEAQSKAIARLDPGAASVPGRWLVLEKAISSLKLQGEDAPLREFLSTETEPELLYAGWRRIQGFCKWKLSRSKSDRESLRWWLEWRIAAARVWENVSESERAMEANNIAWGFYEDAENLTPEERRYALELAAIGAKLAPEEVNTIDTYACCLFINGRREQAIEQIRHCIRLDQENEMWRDRLKKFLATDG